MICLFFIMMMVFVNSIENAEHKVKHLETLLNKEDIDAKSKTWLLMVESGKVDEEKVRRITPKSIFIAPLLNSETQNCQEGYSHDLYGKCVKVIKIDYTAHFEQILARLRRKELEKKHAVPLSNGPLQFSIPIRNIDDKDLKKINDNPKPLIPESDKLNTTSEANNTTESKAIPVPVLLLTPKNQTKEIESSGMGALNFTELYETAQIEGSGFESGDSALDKGTTYSASLISEDVDYVDAGNTDLTTRTEISSTEEETTSVTTEIPSTEGTTSVTAEIPSTEGTTSVTAEIPSTEETPSVTTEILSTTTESPTTTEEIINSTESYQSITDELSINDSVVDLPNINVQSPEIVANDSKSDIVKFPSDHEVIKTESPPTDAKFIRFPEDRLPPPKYYPPSPSPLPNLNSKYEFHLSPLPLQQFLWLPENWKVGEKQPKSSAPNYWAHLPLIRDVNFPEQNRNYQLYFPPNPPIQYIQQQYAPPSRSIQHAVNFNHQPHIYTMRRGEPFRRNGLYQDTMSIPRQNFNFKR